MNDLAIVRLTLPRTIRIDWAQRIAEFIKIKRAYAKVRVDRFLNPMSFNATGTGWALDRYVAQHEREYRARLQVMSDSFKVSGLGDIGPKRLARLLWESINRYNDLINPVLQSTPSFNKKYRVYIRHSRPGEIQVIGGWGYQLIRGMSGLTNESFSKEFTTLDYASIITRPDHMYYLHCVKAKALPYHSLFCTNGVWDDHTRYVEGATILYRV